jgi:hypothetical protein
MDKHESMLKQRSKTLQLLNLGRVFDGFHAATILSTRKHLSAPTAQYFWI